MTDDQGYSQRQMFEMFMESQYWSREQMQDYQRSQLEQMLRHAKTNVPFYKTRLDCMFRRDGSINWDRWGDIPILTKEDVSRNFQALHAASIPTAHGLVRPHTTSSTTGFPVTVLHSELEEDLWQALSWRAHTWWKLDWSANLMQWQSLEADEEANDDITEYAWWGPSWIAKRPGSGRFFRMLRSTPLEKRLLAIKDLECVYLWTRPNDAFAAATNAALNPAWRLPKLQAILGKSMPVEPEHVAACHSQFGARIHSSYSSKEGARMGYSCIDNNSYHLSEEILFCEILDQHGQSAPVGQSGKVIITPFLCSAMPLIRYEQGDIASMLAPCSCGKGLQCLSKIEGRTHHMFVGARGGRFVAEVPDRVRTSIDVRTWQFAQIDKHKVEIRYVRQAPLNTEQMEWAAQKITASFGEAFNLCFIQVDAIKDTASGKFIKYVNEYAPGP